MPQPRREIIIRDHYPPMMNGGNTKQVAAQGVNGDDRLAHVNRWEEMLLKMMGGAGTVNPKTGLKQFYTTSDAANPTDTADYWNTTPYGSSVNYFGGPQQYADAIKGKVTSGQQLTDPNQAFNFYSTYPQYFSQGTGTTTTPATTAGNAFDMPTNIFPWSGSKNTSGGNTFGFNTGSNTGVSGSSQASNTYSGLPSQYRDALLQAILPQLNSAVTNMPGNIDTYMNDAFSGYQSMLNDALRKNIPTAIGRLSNRGILDSTEGQNVLADVIKASQQDTANKAYQTAMQSALLKSQMPQVLGQLAGLGQSSQGASSGQSSSLQNGSNFGLNLGNQFSNGVSYQEDPTVMYRSIADLIRGMM